jgi:hypothetical protein
VVEHLPSNCEALSSNHSIAKKGKEKKSVLGINGSKGTEINAYFAGTH